MLARDTYHPAVAFDDLFPGGEAIGEVDCLGAARTIMRSAGRRRIRAPMSIVGAAYDPTEHTFSLPNVLVGDDTVQDTGLPLFDALQRRFKDGLPQPKMVRVDSEDSYEAFREARRAPYVARLEQRLQDLEDHFREHVYDRHGGGRVAALEAAFERHVSDPNAHNRAILGALEETSNAGTPIPLPLREARQGAIMCWRDGGEILCSVRLPRQEGTCVATTAVPVSRALEETLGAAIAANVPPEEILLVVPGLSQVLGGLALVPQLCRAAPELSAARTPYVGVLVTPTDPALAAAMSLVQRCQKGDPRACAEAGALRYARHGLLRDAETRLTRAQRERGRPS
jgi:hypothetical protein